MKIYYVEDEIELANIVIKYLTKEGYEVKHFPNGEEAMINIFDLVDLWILDIMLPGTINGYDLIKKINEVNPNIPVIFTSARDKALDVIKGLELGSDDYISKPFALKELMLRIKAVLRRQNKSTDILELSLYTINTIKRSVHENNNEIILTSLEYDLLLVLINNLNNPVSRMAIYKYLWNTFEQPNERVVDDLVRRLRKKMPNLKIETIYKLGYRLSS